MSLGAKFISIFMLIQTGEHKKALVQRAKS